MHDSQLPLLIRCALAHAQFETIHPFLDGNGRTGRLLISLMLHNEKSLPAPVLYMSGFLKQNKSDYYEHLNEIRFTGQWERWIRFFLQGVSVVAEDALSTIGRVVALKEACLQKVKPMKGFGVKTMESLFENPITDIKTLSHSLGCSYTKSARVLLKLNQAGIVSETTGHRRNRVFKFLLYLELFEPEPFQPEHAAKPIAVRQPKRR